MGSPHRDAALAALCDRCKAIATASCARCDRPACAEHAAAPGRRCDACESELERRLDRIEPLALGKGAADLGKMLLATAGIGAVFFGGIAFIGLLIAGHVSLAALGAVLAIALIAGLCSAAVLGLLALPFVGGASTIAGSRAIRRRLERRAFLKERPGQRRLPAARGDDDSAIADDQA